MAGMVATRHAQTVTGPRPTLSEPEWLKRCLGALTADYSRPMIPQSLALTTSQRSFVSSRLDELLASERFVDVDKSAVAVTKLLMVFPAGAMANGNSADRAEAYLTAFGDLPTWAVEEACRRWLRGEALQGANLAFAPSPPQLRKAALMVMGPATSQRYHLERLLRAEPVKEFSPEHRKTMLEKIKGLFGSPPSDKTISRRDDDIARRREEILAASKAARQQATPALSAAEN